MVVEDKKQLFNLRTYKKEKCFVSIITNNDNYHYNISNILAIYFRPTSSNRGYIVSIDHPESLNVELELVQQVIWSIDTIYTPDKSIFLKFFKHTKVHDCNLLYNYLNYESATIPEIKDSTGLSFYNEYRGRADINKIIPLLKHQEYQNNLYNFYKPWIREIGGDGWDFLNEMAVKVFYLIANNGIKVDRSILDHHNFSDPRYSIKDSKLYFNYNLSTTTGRPSNSFNNFNFLAIPKSSEVRKYIRPINDKFIEFDFDGYHLRLIADLIGFNLDTTSAHNQIAKMYLNREVTSEEEYLDVKTKNFSAIYGSIPEDYKELEFFKRMRNFIDDLWSTFKEKGKVSVPKSGKEFSTNLKDTYPTKLFNYYIQSYETGRNVYLLKDILRLLVNKRSNICLYTYDSIILDYSNSDGSELLEDIKNILEGDKRQFPVHINESIDFRF